MRTLLLVTAAFATTAIGSSARTSVPLPTYSKSQLAIMVLPQQQFGPEARGLEVSIGSGSIGNAAASEDTIDPKDTGPQLERAGRTTGYALEYGELSLMSLKRGRGLLSLSSSVDLFRSPAAAEAFIAKQLRDALRYRGKYVEAGLHLAEFSTFPVAGVAPKAVGIRQTVTFGDKSFHVTGVIFRRGALTASVGITRADADSVSTRAVRLAILLAERIRLVDSAKLEAQPVAVPAIGRKGRPPQGGPDLAPLALSTSDLPSGAKVKRQEYVADDDSLGNYEREFDVSAVRFGASTLVAVESGVSLFRSPAEAAGFLLVVRALYTSKDLVRLFAEDGIPAAKVELLKSLPAGDEATALVFHATAGSQVIRIAIMFVRSGRTVGVLTLGGTASTFRFSDVEPLAARFATRMQNG